MKPAHKFPYKWRLADGYPAQGIEQHGAKVFGTFICGGGSTMGYKLAGYEHLGGVEIDAPIAAVYQANHHPKHLFHEDIRLFLERDDLPEELYHLDLLDGSPPCSSFSMSGSREKGWDKSKVFREGQADQKLDDLFFTYIALAKKLQPKIVLAENVKGMLQGNAKFYISRIQKEFKNAGYKVQLFCLNSASMGVPQKRERVFFVCRRDDLDLPELRLSFSEPAIELGQVMIKGCQSPEALHVPQADAIRLGYAVHGDRDLRAADFRYRGGNSFFNQKLLYENEVAGTITGCERQLVFSEKRRLSNLECQMIGSYPADYNFQAINPKYLIGMSVPPIMTAQVAHQIYLQWLSKLPA